MAWWVIPAAAAFIGFSILSATMHIAKIVLAAESGTVGSRPFRGRYSRAKEPVRFWVLVALEAVAALVAFALGAFMLSLFLR